MNTPQSPEVGKNKFRVRNDEEINYIPMESCERMKCIKSVHVNYSRVDYKLSTEIRGTRLEPGEWRIEAAYTLSFCPISWMKLAACWR